MSEKKTTSSGGRFVVTRTEIPVLGGLLGSNHRTEIHDRVTGVDASYEGVSQSIADLMAEKELTEKLNPED